MSRVNVSVLTFIAFVLTAMQPALGDGCCQGIPAHPHVMYAAPQPAPSAPQEAPVIQSYRTNQGPHIAGPNLESDGYPPMLYYPSRPALSYPYVHGQGFYHASWQGYGPAMYGPSRPYRPMRRHPRIWK